MKYGKRLGQFSVPAWNCYNVEYNQIKHFIKEQTTPASGKAIPIPGRGDLDKAHEFEDKLYHILLESYHNVSLFVKSKSGEIRSRLAQNEKQLAKLATRPKAFKANRIPLSELQAYAYIEKDVIRAGQDIENLSRFISAQRTAFRKLLKKYRKWTGSIALQERFDKAALDDPKGFNKFDAGILLDSYSALLQTIRTQYAKLIGSQKSSPRPDTPAQAASGGSAAVRDLRYALEKEQKSAFDASMMTVPLGKNGVVASYFVHPENVMELEVFLMQYARYYLSRSRHNSTVSQVQDQLSRRTSFTPAEPDVSDCHAIGADNVDRFVRSVPLSAEEIERRPGRVPQRAKAVVRWCQEELALASLSNKVGMINSACLNQKAAIEFFNQDEDFHAPLEETAQDEDAVERLRREMLQDGVQPLYHYACCRSRFVGLDDSEAGLLVAALDTNIRIDKPVGLVVDTTRATKFPFAILTLRQEGLASSQLLSALDESHLVERVPGFSLEYHCIWETVKPKNMPEPAWNPILKRDIRKLPKLPPKLPRTSTRNSSGQESPAAISPAKRTRIIDQSDTSSGPLSAAQSRSKSPHESNDGTVDSGTAVDHSSNGSPISTLENPPLRAFRKKKRVTYPEALVTPQPKIEQQQRYWNEYDDPEDGEDEEGKYAIYVDPYETSPLERAIDNFFTKIGNLFKRRFPEEEPLLSPESASDGESSDEEAQVASFGTFPRSRVTTNTNASPAQAVTRQNRAVSQFSLASLMVSTVFLVVGYILTATGKHKLATEVHAGVIICVVCSLAAALVGFRGVVKAAGSRIGYRLWWSAFGVLLVDAIAAGGLLAMAFG